MHLRKYVSFFSYQSKPNRKLINQLISSVTTSYINSEQMTINFDAISFSCYNSIIYVVVYSGYSFPIAVILILPEPLSFTICPLAKNVLRCIALSFICFIELLFKNICPIPDFITFANHQKANIR